MSYVILLMLYVAAFELLPSLNKRYNAHTLKTAKKQNDKGEPTNLLF